MVIKLTHEERELYPEHAKLEAIGDKRNAVGDFIEWLSEEGYRIANWHENECSECSCMADQILLPVMKNTPEMLAEYFDVDLIKIEKEKQAMLDSIRKANKNG